MALAFLVASLCRTLRHPSPKPIADPRTTVGLCKLQVGAAAQGTACAVVKRVREPHRKDQAQRSSRKRDSRASVGRCGCGCVCL